MNLHYKRLLVPIILLTLILFLGFASNPPDGNTGAPFDGLCNSCHAGGSYNGTVDITGFPSSITPSTSYPITLTATATTGTPIVGGFQLVVVDASNTNAGDLANTGGQTGTTMSNSHEYIDHRGVKAYSGNSVSWSFNWTSPSASSGSVITMYFSSLMANGNGNTAGDKVIKSSKSGTISGGTPISVNIIAKKNVSCFGGSDGSLTASAGGGVPPYSYKWSNGNNGNMQSMLIAGVYKVTVTDAASATSTTSASILQADSFKITTSIFENPTCPLDSNGQLKINVAGATQPYKYAWSTGETTYQIINKKIGSYKITVSDLNNCIAIRGYDLISVDKTAPTLVAKNSIVYLNQSGKSIPIVSDYIVQNTDNCDPSPIVTFNIDTFRCNHLGIGKYIISSKDVSGNKASDTIEIEVLDTFKPIIHIWKDTIFKRCDIIVPTFTATDNCMVTEFEKVSGPDAGSVFMPGVTVLKYSAMDSSNNKTTDSIMVTILSPLHYTIDSFYFNYCSGDTAFTILSLKHDLQLPIQFDYKNAITKILQDSSFTIISTNTDSLKFRIIEESECSLAYQTEITYPGLNLILDSVKITNASFVNDGKIEVFLSGAADSVAWYDASNDMYVNNTGLNLAPGGYIIKAYKGPCVFVYGLYKVQRILQLDELEELNLRVYPIPFSNNISVHSDIISDINYVLMNTQGVIIRKGQFHSKLAIDANQISSGIYYLKCNGAQKSSTIRLIKI